MFVLNPDPYLKPSYRISPFRTSDIEFNFKLPEDNYIEDYLNNRFKGKNFLVTHNGRDALNLALSHYNLQKDAVVTILTTTGNFYISSCVTYEIEKYCSWSRKIENQTKVLLVNHEFGYPFPELKKLKEEGIPIIEDAAHSFFSNDNKDDVGNVGDFVIYSFPKMFPIQIGGLLVSNIPDRIKGDNLVIDPDLRYIKNVLSKYIFYKDEIIDKRIYNYNYLLDRFESLGFIQRLPLNKNIVPGVFLFRTGNYKLDLRELKKYFYAHGIQCSVFYGEETFFIPVHQALTENDLDYFYEVMKSFIKKI